MDESKKIPNKTNPDKGVRFNILDGVIIAVFVLLIIGVVLITVPSIRANIASGEKTQIKYMLVFKNIDKDIAGNIYDILGDETVTDTETGMSIGKVNGPVDQSDSLRYVLSTVTDESGNNKYFAVENTDNPNGTVDLTVRVEADAVYNEGSGYTVNGVRIAIGAEYGVRLADFTGSAYCASLEIG